MPRISGAELQELFDLVHAFQNKRVLIIESISRERNGRRHDRHSCTDSRFPLKVEHIAATISGAQLLLFGDEAGYGISIDNIVSFQTNSDGLEIVEHFEQQTERKTLIRAV